MYPPAIIIEIVLQHLKTEPENISKIPPPPPPPPPHKRRKITRKYPYPYFKTAWQNVPNVSLHHVWPIMKLL